MKRAYLAGRTSESLLPRISVRNETNLVFEDLDVRWDLEEKGANNRGAASYAGGKENMPEVSAFVGIGVTLIFDPFGVDSISRSATAQRPEIVLLGTLGE